MRRRHETLLGVRRKMDAFSEVLSGVRLKGAMFFSAEFSAPWRLSTPHCRVLASTLAPGAPHIVIYHLVVDGSARAGLEGGPDVELSPGDIVVFPHGDPHHLSGGSGANQVESAAILRKIATRDLSPMQAGGGGATTRFVCGYLTCDPLLCGPILESLPPMLKVNVRTDRSGHWLEQSILHLVEEAASDRAGSDAMLAKLSEALFVDTLQAIRRRPPRSDDGVARGCTRPGRGQEPRAASQARASPMDHRRARRGSRRVPLCAGGAFHALPVGSADGVLDRMAIASGCPGVDVVAEGGGGYRGRRGLRV